MIQQPRVWHESFSGFGDDGATIEREGEGRGGDGRVNAGARMRVVACAVAGGELRRDKLRQQRFLRSPDMTSLPPSFSHLNGACLLRLCLFSVGFAGDFRMTLGR